jgi:Helix-turn-helix domain
MLEFQPPLKSYRPLLPRLTGPNTHQYVRRRRLRDAAIRLMTGHAKVLDIALDCGFGDVSNFNRAFCAEFGWSPLVYRQRAAKQNLISTGVRRSRMGDPYPVIGKVPMRARHFDLRHVAGYAILCAHLANGPRMIGARLGLWALPVAL